MKALLIGNGFSSQYISAYKSEKMMKKFIGLNSDLYSRINNAFEPFRKNVDRCKFFVHAEAYCGEFYCGEAYCSSPSVRFNSDLMNFIMLKFIELGLEINLYKQYFENYGLIYQTQEKEILDIESMLKVVHLFTSNGTFSLDDTKQIEIIANEILYNEGNIGINAIDNKYFTNNVKENVKEWIDEFDYIFTTNYDNLLDELSEKEIQHIHGGFQYDEDGFLKSDYSEYKNATLIWGIDGNDKYRKISGNSKTYPYTYSYTYREESTIFQNYLSNLQKASFEEIHIYGYSGENDNHINERLSKNINLKKIYYYHYPKEIDSEMLNFETEIKFSINKARQELILLPHTEIERVIFN